MTSIREDVDLGIQYANLVRLLDVLEYAPVDLKGLLPSRFARKTKRKEAADILRQKLDPDDMFNGHLARDVNELFEVLEEIFNEHIVSERDVPEELIKAHELCKTISRIAYLSKTDTSDDKELLSSVRSLPRRSIGQVLFSSMGLNIIRKNPNVSTRVKQIGIDAVSEADSALGNKYFEIGFTLHNLLRSIRAGKSIYTPEIDHNQELIEQWNYIATELNIPNDTIRKFSEKIVSKDKNPYQVAEEIELQVNNSITELNKVSSDPLVQPAVQTAEPSDLAGQSTQSGPAFAQTAPTGTPQAAPLPSEADLRDAVQAAGHGHPGADVAVDLNHYHGLS